jgi:nucleotide-binding universal stress UspA family protein
MTDINLNSLDFKGRWKRSISSILVAVDGSSLSFRAADYALELASRYGAKLFLITVSYMPASSSQARTAG